MQQQPMSYQTKGILSGFAALYGLFAFGFLVLCALVIVFWRNSWEGKALAVVFGIGFITLVIYAIIRERNHPDTFATKLIQQHSYTISMEVKMPTEKRPRRVKSKPTSLLENEASKQKRLEQ
jgi:hypothetical protein